MGSANERLARVSMDEKGIRENEAKEAVDGNGKRREMRIVYMERRERKCNTQTYRI